MAEKNEKITLDKIARMVKTGFDNTPTKQQFEVLENKVEVIDERLGRVEKKLNKVDARLIKVEKKLDGFVDGYNEDKLPMRVEYIENILNIPKK